MISAKPIYIDVDDVLAETGQALCLCLYREFGKVVPFEEMAHFDLSRSFGLSTNEMEHLFAVFHREECLLKIGVLPGALDVIGKWHGLGRIIHIVTGRPVYTRELTREWLDMHNIPFHELLHVDKYGRESNGSDALTPEQMANLPFEFAVEDAPMMAFFIANRMKKTVYLMRRPWNRTISGVEHIIPVDSWFALEEMVEGKTI